MTILSRTTLAALLLTTAAASAHHSPIVFDRTRSMTISASSPNSNGAARTPGSTST